MLNPFSENFFLKWLFDFLNPASENFFLKGFVEIVSTILSYLNPFSDNFFLKIAFVPDGDSIRTDVIETTIKNKFSFFSNFSNFFGLVFNSLADESEPEFMITLPGFLGGGTYEAIDFSFYNNYRSWIHGVIIAVSYFLFIKKIAKIIPSVIH